MTIFDHINALTDASTGPEFFDSLDEVDKKTFNPYMVHRILSMHLDLIDIVAEFSQLQLTPDILWKLYYSVLPKKKRFAKYIKSSNDLMYNNVLIQEIANHLQVSVREATDIYYILHNNDSVLTEFLQDMGYDNDTIKTILK